MVSSRRQTLFSWKDRKIRIIQKLEVLRREVSDIPVCRPETVLAYIWSGEIAWSGENTWSGEECPGRGNRRNGKCPVLTAAQKDRILEVVIGHMDRYCRGRRR